MRTFHYEINVKNSTYEKKLQFSKEEIETMLTE